MEQHAGQKCDYHCCEYPFCIKNVVTLVFNPSAESQVGADRDNRVQKKLIRFRQMAVGDTDCYSQNQGQRTQAYLIQCLQNRRSSAIHPGTDEILVDAERKIRKQ